MVEFFRGLFSNAFMPHGMCYLWDPAVLWLNVISDGLISLSYYAIPILLIAFFRKRQDLNFRWIFVAFAIFIVACGTTHAMGVWTVWHGAYRLDGVIKAITALASLATAALLIPLLPALVRLPSPAALQQLNQKLQVKTDALEQTAASLQLANFELKQQIERGVVLEDQLVQAQKMEAIGRLAGGVAHDFNNMLTVILGYNRMVLDDEGQRPDTLENAGEVQRAAERAASLTKQLLAFSRRQVFQPRAIDLNDVVGNMEKLLRPVIGEDIEFATHLDPTLAAVQADPSHVDQIIMNLVVNAKDAMRIGGKLTIETANVNLDEEYVKSHPGIAPGRYVQLAIGDNGPGMSEETKRRIFEPFFTTKEMGQGTGMGLSIVFGIVKQSGGDISVDSQEGRGTTFKICLPAATTSAISVEVTKPSPAPIHRGKEVILLVEDEANVRGLVRSMLVKQGYTVLESRNVHDAIRMCKDHRAPIDLLVTDVVMPDLSGPELAEQLAGLYPELRVLFMSGYADTAIARNGGLPQNAAFLQKPFFSGELKKKVREVLEA